MRFDVITMFPELFEPFTKESLLKRAQAKGILSVEAHNLRKWTKDKHRVVDAKPYGGGLGMVMKIEPIFKAVQSLKSKIPKSKVILFTPRGKKFTQQKAHAWAKLDQLIFICGRYEGVDERAAKHIADEEISIGDYVLMGGEVAAMAAIETVSRLIPGVIGKETFLKERKQKTGFLEYPQYTRPEVFRTWQVPKVLLSGNHKKIEEWKKKHGRLIGRK
ncbi:MAG: tRNA (guanosine(37)-N1)-methyltransferase TrmD [Parcubacteria group bacterium]|nr:tRNA (guanosine(37)-N1)-methyltransferase TrmD [Parcubacteria group bacterium]